MALPPRDEMVCTPEPPSWQPWFPAGRVSGFGVCVLGVARGVGVRDSRGLSAVFAQLERAETELTGYLHGEVGEVRL
ncbi:hypothetical protein, partial [Streptomyces sp. NPDC051098]|uniref:hypothetical protein n=1 Tax=Streptomyces sp. NPDC051098 TaxID=3155411 RepID=UPI00341BF57C